MNNITSHITSTIINMFADDSKIITSIKNPDDRKKLLTDLMSLITWTENNAMKFNEDKFQLQQIGDDEQLKLPYKFNNIELNKSENVRDLGIHISEDLNFKYHISEMIHSATNFASWLLRTFWTREKDVMMLLLKTYIKISIFSRSRFFPRQ